MKKFFIKNKVFLKDNLALLSLLSVTLFSFLKPELNWIFVSVLLYLIFLKK